MNITNQEIRQINAMFDRYDKIIRKHIAETFIKADEEMTKVSVVEAVFRDMITTTYNKCTPFSLTFPMDLAIRLASLSLSVVPIENQEVALHAFMANFEKAHKDRLMRKVIQSADWDMGPGTGVSPNMPDDKDLN